MSQTLTLNGGSITVNLNMSDPGNVGDLGAGYYEQRFADDQREYGQLRGGLFGLPTRLVGHGDGRRQQFEVEQQRDPLRRQ